MGPPQQMLLLPPCRRVRGDPRWLLYRASLYDNVTAPRAPPLKGLRGARRCCKGETGMLCVFRKRGSGMERKVWIDGGAKEGKGG